MLEVYCSRGTVNAEHFRSSPDSLSEDLEDALVQLGIEPEVRSRIFQALHGASPGDFEAGFRFEYRQYPDSKRVVVYISLYNKQIDACAAGALERPLLQPRESNPLQQQDLWRDSA